MPSIVAESELFRSCEILFGLDLNLSREFLEYLQHAGIKSAYRKKARETHPDLAAGKSEIEKKALAAVFQSVHEAYENLTTYLDARDKGYKIPASGRSAARGYRAAAGTAAGRSPSSAARSGAARRPGPGANAQPRAGRRDYTSTRKKGTFNATLDTDHYYRGPMPNRKLLFGHYLYYAGVINWRGVIQALVWQRMQRPRLGELGQKLGWLSESDIRRVMEYRTPFQPFGASAVKLGLLTEQQCNVLVFQQKRMQKRFGQYFVENKKMSPQMLRRHVDSCNAHNARVQASSSFWYNC